MKFDTPVFNNADELAATWDALGKTPASKRQDVTKHKTSATLFDVFQKLRDAKTKEQSDRLVKEHKLLSDLVEGKHDLRRFIHLRLKPSLAHISDADGRVQVGDRVYEVLNERDAVDLMMMMPEPEPDPDPGGGGGSGGTGTSYVFTEDPPEDWVIWLPCGPWVLLPGYPTHFFDAQIGGRVVIVQLWKGSCPDYLGHGAGGVGAEVGIYNRDAWQPHNFWWPDYQHEKLIEFTLFNPVTTGVFFSAPSSTPIWWRHKWMKFPSYDQYVKDQQNKVPASTEEYVLRFKIDGKSFEW